MTKGVKKAVAEFQIIYKDKVKTTLEKANTEYKSKYGLTRLRVFCVRNKASVHVLPAFK